MRNTINNFVFGNRYDWSDPFTIVIDTRNTKTGGSADNEFLFPQNTDTSDAYINFLVDWGDGQFSRIKSKTQAIIPHVYSIPGVYTLNFYKPKTTGTWQLSPRYEYYYPNETNKLIKILKWGKFNNSRACFSNCVNLDLSQVEGIVSFNNNGERNFIGCKSLTTFKGLNDITFNGTFAAFFQGCTNFNQACNLNIKNASSMTNVFYDCIKLNSQVIINAPKATVLKSFFEGCTTLDILPVFNTPNVTDASEMFKGCTNFNKDVSQMLDWSKVTDMAAFMLGKSSTNYNAGYYDNLLIALDNAGRSNVTLGMGTIKCTSAGVAARSNLLSKGWTITDGMI